MRLRADLLRVLTRYPEARAEVAALFRSAGERAAAEMRAGEPRAIEHAACFADKARLSCSRPASPVAALPCPHRIGRDPETPNRLPI
jgi:hypothetical protein